MVKVKIVPNNIYKVHKFDVKIKLEFLLDKKGNLLVKLANFIIFTFLRSSIVSKWILPKKLLSTDLYHLYLIYIHYLILYGLVEDSIIDNSEY